MLVLELLAGGSRADAQIAAQESTSPAAPRLGPAIVTRYRTGAVIKARNGAVRNLKAMVAAPLECREQTVQTLSEEISPSVRDFQYRLLPGQGARQMLIYIPGLRGGEEAQAVVTYEVVTHAILPPEDPSGLTAPERPDREIRQYLGPSPYVDVNHRKIRKAVEAAFAALEASEDEEASAGEEVESADGDAEDADVESTVASRAGDGETDEKAVAAVKEENAADKDDPTSAPAAEPTDWQRIEAIYDYVIEKVQYEEGVDQSSVQVLERGVGDCQAIGALFVAMCRTEEIPARLVWVHDHQYAEFYLVDAAGAGHWYPVETAGTPAFGEMRVARVILQKGDNFRVPERRGERLRYASDYLTGLPAGPGGGKPSVKYIREQL